MSSVSTAAKCRYGDVESAEEVPCAIDPRSGGLRCPQPRPHLRRSRNAPKHLEMEVRFVGEGGQERIKTMVAKFEDDVSEPLSLGGSSTSSSSDLGIELRQLDNGGHGCESDSNRSAAIRHEETIEEGSTSPGHREKAGRFASARPLLFATLSDVTGEFVGTFFLTLVICTSVASSVVAEALSGLWQVAVVSGIGVAISIYCTAHISDAHLNPAVTIAFALVRWRVFSWRKVLPYILAQMLGAIGAGAVVYGFYRHAIVQFEAEHGLVRGEGGSQLTAMLFGEYFPNPAMFNHSLPEEQDVISVVEAMLIEAWGTGILVFVIFCFTDPHNTTVGGGGNKVVVPLLIGTTVSVLISLYAPLTQAGWNPARDFGPRIVAVFTGWWKIAIPGPRNGFWVYIVGPLLGGPVAAALYDHLVARVVRLVKKRDGPAPLEQPLSSSNPLATLERLNQRRKPHSPY